ncbi:MAG: PQQ-dependent sugar dehydrogenase [bacterium]|nr:PQQ-dependent sugar dehydrogenase [bacterium]
MCSIKRFAALSVLLLVAGHLAADPPDLSLALVTGGLSSPVGIANAGDGSGRLFIVEQAGSILIWNGLQLLPQPFLDISSLVSSSGERGLLSVAFHPDYGTNGRFFVNYTNTVGDTVIARYEVSAGNANQADVSTGVILMTIQQPSSNHNGGQVAFGRDGYLYVGMGDGGSSNDPSCFAQRSDSLHGKVLRLDVDANVDTSPFHGVPGSNPFVGAGTFDERVWALGYRNPWRFSFDRLTGDLWVGDVGQGAREEIDFEPFVTPGGLNYGWKVMEGTTCADPDPIDDDCPNDTPSCFDASYTDPILEYETHSGDNCAVTGGFRYRGSFHPPMTAWYFYADYCSGDLWGATDDGGTWNSTLLLTAGFGVTSFGEDETGEIYLVRGDSLYRLTEPTGIFGDGFEFGNTDVWTQTVP